MLDGVIGDDEYKLLIEVEVGANSKPECKRAGQWLMPVAVLGPLQLDGTVQYKSLITKDLKNKKVELGSNHPRKSPILCPVYGAADVSAATAP